MNTKSLAFRVLMLGALALAVPVRVVAAQSEPSVRRFALVASSNDGGQDRVRLRFAGSDAKAMADVLVGIGGVENEDLTLLDGVTRASLQRAFETIRVLAEATPAGRRRELVVYYSGHSDEEGLLLGGQRTSYRELREWLNASGVEVRIAILDSCASGAMIRLRGGAHRSSFLSDLSSDARGHAFLTASSADEAAQESDRIGAGFFSHYLISGLRGAADNNRDGRVTLGEAYQFAYDETLRRTHNTAAAQHPAYDFQLSGKGDLVLTDLRSSSASLILEADVAGRVHVRDANERLLVELSKEANYPVRLGLGDGRYTVSVARGPHTYRAGAILRAGGATRVGTAQLVSVGGQPATARGEAAGEETGDQGGNASTLRTLIGSDSLVGQTREIGGYGGVGFHYTRIARTDSLLVSGELALLLNRRIALGLAAGGGIAGADESTSLGFGALVFRYQFLFGSPFSLSLGALAGAGGIDRNNDEENGDSALFLFQPEAGGYLILTRFLRLGVHAGYRFAASGDSERNRDARGPAAGLRVEAGWF